MQHAGAPGVPGAQDQAQPAASKMGRVMHVEANSVNCFSSNGTQGTVSLRM